MKGFAILNANPGTLTPEAANQLAEVVSEAEKIDRKLDFEGRMQLKDAEFKAQLEREKLKQSNKGMIQRLLPIEQSKAYEKALDRIDPSDINKINKLNSLYGLPLLEDKTDTGKPSTSTGTTTTESGSFFNWLNGKAAGGATEPPGTAIPQVINESPISVGGGVISAPLIYDPATKTFKVQTSP